MLSHMENSISAGMLAQQQAQQHNSHTAPVNIPGSPMNNAMAGLFQGGNTSAPVNIPSNNSLSNFSPTTNHLFGDPFQHAVHGQQQQHMGGHGHGSAPKMGNGPMDSLFFQSQLLSPSMGDPLSSISPDLRMSAMENTLKSFREELHSNGGGGSGEGGLYDNGLGGYSKSPCLNPGGMTGELDRLKAEVINKTAQLQLMAEQQNKWKMEADDNSRKVRGERI